MGLVDVELDMTEQDFFLRLSLENFIVTDWEEQQRSFQIWKFGTSGVILIYRPLDTW